MHRFIIVALLSIVIGASAAAQELRYDIYEFKLKYGSVLVLNEKIFSEQVNLSIAIPIPKDARGVIVAINQEPAKVQSVEDQQYKFLIINKTGTERIRISYITELQPQNEFLISLRSTYQTDVLQASLTLTPEAVPEIPFLDEGRSIYPKPDTIDKSAGSTIYIWERHELKQGDELSLYVKFRHKTSLFLSAVPIALFLVILGFYLYYLRAHRRERIK